MNSEHTFEVSKQLWAALRSGDLAKRFEAKGLPAPKGFAKELKAVSSSGFLLSLAGSEVPDEVPHPCTGLAYSQARHKDFCLRQWLAQDGNKNKDQGPSICNAIDGCCFVEAAVSASAIDDCIACADCFNNTHPCGSCCPDMPKAPVFEVDATCNPDISPEVAWCACAVEEVNIAFRTTVILCSAIGFFACLGILIKFFFDGMTRRMFRKQRERAAVFAAAQIELGYMLRDQEDDAIL